MMKKKKSTGKFNPKKLRGLREETAIARIKAAGFHYQITSYDSRPIIGIGGAPCAGWPPCPEGPRRVRLDIEYGKVWKVRVG